MQIRFMNLHAQSKDPCTLIQTRPREGVPPNRIDRVERALLPAAFEVDQEGHEFHSRHISAQPGTRLQPIEARAFFSFFLLVFV